MKYLLFISYLLLFSCNGRVNPLKTKNNLNTHSKNELNSKKKIVVDTSTEDLVETKKNVQKDTLLIDFKNNQIINFIPPENLLEDFKFQIHHHNKILIYNLLYENILGKVIKIKSNNEIKKIQYKIKIEFGVSQYAMDKYYDLNYPIYLTSKSLEVSKSSIELPEYSYVKSDTEFGRVFDFENNEELINYLEEKHFNKIKPISLKKHRIICRNLLKNKKKYACCSEYIKEAKKFLVKKKFDSFNDLNVEIIINKIQLEITLINIKSKKNNIEITNMNF